VDRPAVPVTLVPRAPSVTDGHHPSTPRPRSPTPHTYTEEEVP